MHTTSLVMKQIIRSHLLSSASIPARGRSVSALTLFTDANYRVSTYLIMQHQYVHTFTGERICILVGASVIRGIWWPSLKQKQKQSLETKTYQNKRKNQPFVWWWCMGNHLGSMTVWGILQGHDVCTRNTITRLYVCNLYIKANTPPVVSGFQDSHSKQQSKYSKPSPVQPAS